MAKKQQSAPKVGFWQMVRDVLVASLNKGQFPLACCFVLAIVISVRMPEGDLSKLAWRLLDDLESGKVLGYALFVLALLGWYGHSRFLRKMASDEMNRVTRERNRLQEKAIGQPLESSDKK
jgi:hypothetical protein